MKSFKHQLLNVILLTIITPTVLYAQTNSLQDSFTLKSIVQKIESVSLEIASSTKSNVIFSKQIIIQAGESIDGSNIITSLGPGPSINNKGKIAFSYLEASKSNFAVSLYDKGTYVRNFYDPADKIGTTVQVNDIDHIAYTSNHINDTLFTFAKRLDTDEGGDLIASGSPWEQWSTQFYRIIPYLTLNNNDRVVFSGDLRGDKILGVYFAGPRVMANRTSGSDAYQMSEQLLGSPIFFPMISDDNRTIVRGGASETASIKVFLDETLNSSNSIDIATYPEFTRMGDKPGISDDGRIAVFMAENNKGETGIYVTTINGKGQAVQFLLTNLPGDNVNLNYRVAVNRSGTDSEFEYVVVYLANNNQGALSLNASTIDVSNPYSPVLKSETAIVKVGETIDGLKGNIKKLEIYDPVNNLGEIVFWVLTETNNNQAIIKASNIPIAFIDDYPDYTKDDNEDTDNYFLRQDDDYKEIKIYYQIDDNLPVEDVKINIYAEMESEPIQSLKGEKNDDNSFKTGDNLHVIWDKVKDGDSFREYGFYRLELEVKFEGEENPIKTSIEDADPDMPGWQCPQDGVGIHDLVFKHRPVVYAGSNEIVTPNGPVHPFSYLNVYNYRLLEYHEHIKGGTITEALNYGEKGSFPNILDLDDTYPVLEVLPSSSNARLFLEDDRRYIPQLTQECLFHRGHPYVDYIFIHFWMFHPRSHSPYGPFTENKFRHEGDWEMVQLCIQNINRLQKSNKGQWLLPFAATASQHYYGQTLAWRIDKQDLGSDNENQRYVETTENGKRINVYVAENSHACYFRKGIIKVPPSIDAGCGIQVQYENFAVYKDIISSPLNKVEYKLQALEERDGKGIYDWPGMWGEYETKNDFFGLNLNLDILTAHSPKSPRFRETKINLGGTFHIDALPIYFHSLCQKKVDIEGNFSKDGNPDPLTDLIIGFSENKSLEIDSPYKKGQVTLKESDFLWANNSEEALAIMGTSVTTDNNNNVILSGLNIYDSKLDSKELLGSEYASSFVAKYDTSGVLIWLRQIAGSNDIYALDIVTDNDGAIYVTGGFKDTLSIGSNTFISDGFSDVFLITKVSQF